MDNTRSKVIKLNIIQWNAQSLRSKLIAFEQFLSQEKIHIAALSETWLTPDISIKVNGYNIYRKDRDGGWGGVAILVHKSIKAVQFNIDSINSGIEMLGIRLYNCDQIQNLISLYCAPLPLRTTQRDWDHLLSTLSSKTLILGDFNGHHTNWSYKTDQRGSQIFDALIDSSFITLNNGQHTRLKLVNNALQKSSPDLSLSSSDIALRLNWVTLSETLGSDHLIIKITSCFNSSTDITKKRNFKLADWSAYKEILESTFTNFVMTNDLQLSYNRFVDYLNIAADSHIPYIKINPNPQSKFAPKPYWNVSISKIVAERRLALSKFRRNPTPNNLTCLQKKVSEAQLIIRKAKDKAWHDYCSSIDASTSQSELWRKLKWFKGYNAPRSHIDKDKANQLLQSLTPDYARPPDPIFTSCNYKLGIPILKQEVEHSMRRKDTSPGCDNISYSMIANLPDNGKIILTKLCNEFYKTGFVPVQWRDIVVVPIPKPGRDIQSISALRPISMISCLCKIFHNILISRLEWFVEKNDILSPNTIGFRKGCSTLDNITSLVTRIQAGFLQRKSTIACFIDIDNAYNNVDVKGLLDTMDKIGVGTQMCRYIWNFLKERNLKIRSENTFLCRSTCRGLAQGDPFSPLLFNIVTVYVCKEIKNVNISQYADDFVLYVSCNDTNNGVLKLQSALNKLIIILKNVGLSISPDKSRVCVFKNSIFRDPINLTINDLSLQIVDNYKYLGLWLDRSLRWAKHINEIKEKTAKFLNIFKVLAGSGWGMHPRHLRRLYIASIRSRLDYASFIYGNSCKTHLGKLDRTQNQCMRVIGGFIRSTAIHVMECELYLQPLGVRRYYLAGKYWLKRRSDAGGEIIHLLDELNGLSENTLWRRRAKPLLVIIHNLYKDIPIHSSHKNEMFSLDQWVSSVDISNLKFNIDFVNKPKRSYNADQLKNRCEEYLSSEYKNYYRIYTDGSKVNDMSGLAIFDPQTNSAIKVKIKTKISIMSTELIAIAEAISYIDSFEAGYYVVLSDSKSAIQHIARCTTRVRGTPIAYSILESIIGLSARGKHVSLQWIPSHVGLSGNDEADRLAGEALVDGITMDFLPYHSDLLTLVKEKCRNNWKEYFDERSLTKGIWYRTIQPGLSRSPWFEGSGMVRSDIVTMMRLRSGHIPLNSFGHLMGKVTSPNCTECNVIEGVYHIVAECVRNEAERRAFVIKFSHELFFVGSWNAVLTFPLAGKAKDLIKIVKLGINRR